MSSTNQMGSPAPTKSPSTPPGGEAGEGEKYIIAAVSGMVAFSVDRRTAEKIDKFIKEMRWKIYEIPQFERRHNGRNAPTYEVLVKLLPQHWLYFSYSQNRAYFEFSSPEWLSDEEAQRKIKEEDGWEERHFILCPALRTRLFGCTSRIKTLPPPPQ